MGDLVAIAAVFAAFTVTFHQGVLWALRVYDRGKKVEARR